MRSILTGAAILLMASTASAQTQFNSRNRATNPSPRSSRTYRPPVTSPFINLIGNNANPAVVYQGIVLPQLEQQRFDREQVEDNNRLARDIDSNSRKIREQNRTQQEQMTRLAQDLGLKSRETGVRAEFMNRSRHFPGLR